MRTIFFLKHIRISLSLVLLLSASSLFANTLTNFEQQLASYKGKIVYVDFWASWCGPCRKSFPWMNEMQAKYSEQGFAILSVNLDSDKASAETFLQQTPANFDIFYDPKGKVAKAFKLRGMPSSFIVDKTGQIISRHVGFNEQKQQQYQQEIITLLNQDSTKNDPQ